MEEKDCEIDATVIFKQDAGDLTSVKTFEEAIGRFGFTKDDRVTRREMVVMYKQIKTAMEKEIFELANSSRYAEAKEMRSDLNNIRHEFDHLQVSGVEAVRKEQNEQFSLASEELLRNLKNQHSVSVEELDQHIDNQWQNHEFYKSIQNENLEQAISKIPRPNMRYSKRLIELFKSEYNLNRLHQYDEAIKVRLMIDKILPKEREAFYKAFDASIEKMRKKLADEQKLDDGRLEEKLKGTRWTDIRRRELEMKIETQRVKNHTKDMTHAHTMQAKLKPEMSIKPSALWQTRQGYQKTSASLRGQQLRDHVRGKKDGQLVYAESLVDKHDFVDIPQDTTTFYMSK